MYKNICLVSEIMNVSAPPPLSGFTNWIEEQELFLEELSWWWVLILIALIYLFIVSLSLQGVNFLPAELSLTNIYLYFRPTATEAVTGAARGDCTVPLRKTAFSQVVFSFRASHQWNSVPQSISESPSYHSFKGGVSSICKHNIQTGPLLPAQRTRSIVT